MNLGADLFSLSDPRAHKYAKPLPKAASWKMADELLVAVLKRARKAVSMAGDGPGAAGSARLSDHFLPSLLSCSTQYAGAVELLRGAVEGDVEEAIASCWVVTEQEEQVETQIDGKKFKLQVPKPVAQLHAQGNSLLEAAIGQWQVCQRRPNCAAPALGNIKLTRLVLHLQCAVEGRVASAALEVRCAERHLAACFLRTTPDGSFPAGRQLPVLESLLAGASQAATECPTTFRLLKTMAAFIGASYVDSVEDDRGELLAILQRHHKCLPWSCALFQPGATALVSQLQMLAESHRAMRPVLTRAMPPQDEAPLLVEDHSQSLETLLLQLPWDALDSISADSVQQQLLPAVANMLDVLLAHSQEPMGVPSALLTIVRILAMVANRGAQGQLLLPVTDVLLDARWPAPVFVPLLLPITPLDKAEAPTLQHMLHRLLRLQEKDVLAYAQTPAASRSVVRRMFQSAAVEGRAVVAAVYQQPLYADLQALPAPRQAPRGMQARPSITGPCSFPVLAAIRQVAAYSALTAPDVSNLQLVAEELVYHATMGDAAVMLTGAATRPEGDRSENASATARRFCDEAVLQLGALCGLMPGAWILAVEAVITNNALLHSAEADASEALPCSQAFASRLGSLMAAVLPYTSDTEWMMSCREARGPAGQVPGSALTVERAMQALVKLTWGVELEALVAGPQPSELASETGEEQPEHPVPEPTVFDEAAKEIGAASLPPTLRLRCLLTVLAAHCHLVSGQPTEGGLWLWRFMSGPGGQQLTALTPRDSGDDQSVIQQAAAEFRHVCMFEPPASGALELQMLWGIVRLQLAAGLVEHSAAEPSTGESADCGQHCKDLLEAVSWWTRASQLIDAGLGEGLVPLVGRMIAGLAGLPLLDHTWAATSAGRLLAAMMATVHSSTPSAIAEVVSALISKLRKEPADPKAQRAIELWLQALCYALVQGNEAAEAAVCAILAEVVSSAWVASQGAAAMWQCWAQLVEALNEVELAQMTAQLHAASERLGSRNAGWLALLRTWVLQAKARQGKRLEVGDDEAAAEGQASQAMEVQVEGILQSLEAAQAVLPDMPVCLPLWLAFASEYCRLQDSVKEIVDREEVGIALLKLGGWFEAAEAPLLATYCTQAAALDPALLGDQSAADGGGAKPAGGLPDLEHWEEYARIHPPQLLQQRLTASEPRTSADFPAGDTGDRASQEESSRAAKAELLQHTRKPAIVAADALQELQEIAGSGMLDAPEDDDTAMVELQSWGRRGQKQAAKSGKTPQGEASLSDLRMNVGDGEGDVPQVLSRCQVQLWEANMAVQGETAPINEQLRELLRNRYSEEAVSMPGTVDIGHGERRRVSLQVRCSKEAEGWQQLLASNRQAAEHSVTLGLLEARFMTDAASALQLLESTLASAGVTEATATDDNDGDDLWNLRQQLCMVLCDVLIDGSTPPLGQIPLRRLFVQSARRLAAARPAMQPELISHMLLAAQRCVASEEKNKTSDVGRVGPSSSATLEAFSGCLRALLHNGHVLSPGSVRALLDSFDVQQYVAAEVGDGIVDSEDNTAAPPERLERAFRMAADALRLPGAEVLSCQLLEAIVCAAPSQHFAACAAIVLATPAGCEDARKQALDMLAKLPFEILSANVVADVLRSMLAALQADVLSPPYLPYDLIRALLQSPGMVALLEGNMSVAHPSTRAEWSADVLQAGAPMEAAGGASGGGGGEAQAAECSLVRVRQFPPDQSPQLLSDLLAAILQKLTCLYDSMGSAGMTEELTAMLSAWIGAAASSEPAMNLAWQHYCSQWQPFLALTGALTQGAVGALFSSFWNGLPWEMATFHSKGANALVSIREQLPHPERAALKVLQGLRWEPFLEDLNMKVGILSSAAAASNGGESTEEEGLAEARNLATQAALLAIDAYLLAGVEGVPGWMATLLAVDVSEVDEGSGDEAGQEGLRMAQLLAVADWAVLEAYLCPEPPEEEGAGLARQPASLPAGQSFGLLRPLLDAPALVAAGVDHRLLQVLMSLKDAALVTQSEHATAVAAAAARGVLLVSIGPTSPPQAAPGPDSALVPAVYWHLGEAHHGLVMERVLVPLLAAPSSGSAALLGEIHAPSLIVLEATVAGPVLHEAVERVSFANSALPLGVSPAGKSNDGLSFVEKMQAQASSWLSHIHVRRDKQAAAPEAPTPNKPPAGQQASRPQVALRTALLRAAASSPPQVCLRLARTANHLALAGTAPQSLLQLGDSCLRCALGGATAADGAALGQVDSEESVQLQVMAESAQTGGAAAPAQVVSPLTAALQCVAGLTAEQLALLGNLAAGAGAPLCLALVIEQKRRDAMSIDDAAWQQAACAVLGLAAEARRPPAATAASPGSAQPDMLLLWLAVLSWLADARWSRVSAQPASTGAGGEKDPKTALRALLDTLEARVTLLRRGGGGSGAEGAGSGEAEGDKHAKVSERLRNVKSGLSSFLHVPSKDEGGASSGGGEAPAAGEPQAAGDPKAKASRFNFGSLKSSLGEAAKAGQGVGSSLKMRFKGMGAGDKAPGGVGPKSSGGLVFPQGTTVPVMHAGIDTQVDSMESMPQTDSPMTRDAPQPPGADAMSQGSASSGSAGGDAVHRAREAVAGGFRAFMTKIDKLPGGQEGGEGGGGLVSGLADRFRELRHAAAGGGPSGAEPAEMATDAIALALAAHAIVAYVGSILCPALLKSTRRVGLADIPPSANSLSMSQGEDALLSEMDLVLEQRGALDALQELAASPLVAANPAPFEAFFAEGEALLSHATSVEVVQSRLPALLLPAAPHLRVFDPELRLAL
eukprot:jgi/Tetstr1/425746/TSEL_016166.t1